MKTGPEQWANRAASAEAAIVRRHLRQLWRIPGTQLGVVGWPPSRRDRSYGTWHYWWQAHLLDTLVDAQLRDPRPERAERIRRQIRGHRIRNNGRWTNRYYDDMAWLALALERAGRLLGIARPQALQTLTRQLFNSWMPEYGGGIPWRKQDQFFNAPANGPAGIVLARCGQVPRAAQMADWIDRTLLDPETQLIFDGIRDGSLVRAQYTYCQGVVIGLETELAVRTGDHRHAPRARRLIAAVGEHLAPQGVLRGAGVVMAGCSPASPRVTSRWRPPIFQVTPRRTSPRARPLAASCWPRPRRPGTTGRPSTACRCSARSGTGSPRSHRSGAEAPASSTVRLPPRRRLSATCPFRSPGGC